MIQDNVILKHRRYQSPCVYVFLVQSYEWYGNGEPSLGDGRYKPKGGMEFIVKVDDEHGAMYMEDELEQWFKHWLNESGQGEHSRGEVYHYYTMLEMRRESFRSDITKSFNAQGGLGNLTEYRNYAKREAWE